jgi:hypothetical protein
MRTVLVFLVGAAAAAAQPVTPEQAGVLTFQLDAPETGPVHYYVSTAGRPADTTRALPLVVFFQGSGYGPIYRSAGGVVRNALLLTPQDVPEAHFAVISKPGAPFWAEDADPAADPPAAYSDRLSLGWRTAAGRLVIEDLVGRPWVDPSVVLAVGHSEGSDVVPWVALETPAVTHVATLAGGALSQAFDFVYEFRRLADVGEMSFEESQAYVDSVYADLRAVYAEPERTDREYLGATYLKWASFLGNPPLDALVRLDIPIYAAGGTLDTKAPIANLDYLMLEFIRRGKENLTYRVWSADHSFQEPTEGGVRDRIPDLVADLRRWVGWPPDPQGGR